MAEQDQVAVMRQDVLIALFSLWVAIPCDGTAERLTGVIKNLHVPLNKWRAQFNKAIYLVTEKRLQEKKVVFPFNCILASAEGV